MNLFAFFAPGAFELCVIAGIAVLLFGNKLPGIANSVGRSFVEFKKGVQDVKDVKDDLTGEIKDATKLE